jgi:hypothetical protein
LSRPSGDATTKLALTNISALGNDTESIQLPP